MTLLQALTEIKKAVPMHDVVFIEHEDGSRMKFNYRFKGDKANRFIDFSTNEFIQRLYTASAIMDKW
jgi:hypothetical protein